MTTIAVGIINYNTRDLLAECLRAVQLNGPDECFVVDNASSDESAQMVQAEFPNVALFANQVNSGFGSAANQIIRATESDYLLLLNSDTIPEPGAIRALADYLDRHPQVGVAGPRLTGRDGDLQHSCRRTPGTLAWLIDNSFTARLVTFLPAIVRRRSVWCCNHDSRSVPWILGAAMAFRMSAIKAIDGFDLSYFMYCEEIDLCLRIVEAGWLVHYAPVATIQHVGGASADQQPGKMKAALAASTACFYKKHYSGPRLAALLALGRLQAFGRRVRLSLTRRNGKRLKASDSEQPSQSALS